MNTPNRLNILYVGTLPPHPGGSAISAVQLLVAFTRLGHRVRALAPISQLHADRGNALASFGVEFPVTRYTVSADDLLVYRPGSLADREAAAIQIRELLPKLIAEERPDFVFMGRELFALDVPQIAGAYGLPTVLRVAGGTLVGLVNGYYPQDLARELCSQFRKTHLLITPGQSVADNLRGLQVDNVKVVLNAVDQKRFHPQRKSAELLRRLAISPEETVVGYIGNLHERKRPLDLVASAASALRQCPNLVYIVVGAGPQQQAVVEACRQHGILERFRFEGWRDYSQIPTYMNLADMVIMTSMGEGLARVYVETQSCGRVLIASDIEPAREVVRHGETGLLFPLGDSEALARQTVLAATDLDLRARIEKQALEAARSYGMEAAAKRYVDHFRGIL